MFWTCSKHPFHHSHHHEKFKTHRPKAKVERGKFVEIDQQRLNPDAYLDLCGYPHPHILPEVHPLTIPSHKPSPPDESPSSPFLAHHSPHSTSPPSHTQSTRNANQPSRIQESTIPQQPSLRTSAPPGTKTRLGGSQTRWYQRCIGRDREPHKRDSQRKRKHQKTAPQKQTGTEERSKEEPDISASDGEEAGKA